MISFSVVANNKEVGLVKTSLVEFNYKLRVKQET